MKLVVLAGAKEGTEIPLKKEKFLIGRASDCTLRAGSEAISRHHCLVTRVDGAVAVRDLGSRNGTHVNGEKIAAETPLNHGDLLRVGPLEFRFEAPQPVAVAAPVAPADNGAAPAAHRRPKVTGVADVVARSAAAEKPESLEEDISRWLLEPMVPGTSMKETMSFRMDETRAVQQLSGETAPVDEVPAEATAEAATSDSGVSEIDPKTGKKKVGKLPTQPPKAQSKDSREAAVQILRDMARRR
jgi:predicted component of type VI protein secretion system